MSLAKEGWIEKKGQTFMAGYRKRWLVLYTDKTLKYFEDTYYEVWSSHRLSARAMW